MRRNGEWLLTRGECGLKIVIFEVTSFLNDPLWMLFHVVILTEMKSQFGVNTNPK